MVSRVDDARTPTLIELDFAARAQIQCATKTQYAELFAEFADQLLAPFEELQRDLKMMGDRRVAGTLDDLLRTAKGMP